MRGQNIFVAFFQTMMINFLQLILIYVYNMKPKVQWLLLPENVVYLLAPLFQFLRGS